MNWKAFLTHFVCVMLGGTFGVLAMALLVSGRDG